MKAATLGVVRPPAASTTSPGAPAIAQGMSACSNLTRDTLVPWGL